MQLLSYNPEDDEYFVGLSPEKFEQVAREYEVGYVYCSNYNKIKEETFERYYDDDYQEHVKECYKIKKVPFAYIVANGSCSEIAIRPWDFPISQMWNAYSPWKAIVAKEIESLNFHHIEIEYVYFSEVLETFCDEWIRKFADEKITYYQLIEDMSFPNHCFSFGWKVDDGVSFQEEYPCNSYEETLEYVPQVTDIKLLGNLLFSHWRYFNHWAYSGAEILELQNREWFVTVLMRLKELALTNKDKCNNTIIR